LPQALHAPHVRTAGAADEEVKPLIASPSAAALVRRRLRCGRASRAHVQGFRRFLPAWRRC
jgi:hypothetical protein